jgi:hypothetical protein
VRIATVLRWLLELLRALLESGALDELDGDRVAMELTPQQRVRLQAMLDGEDD